MEWQERRCGRKSHTCFETLFSKMRHRAPLKQNTCRCAGAPAAPRFGCCICFKLKLTFQCFFAAKPQRSKIITFWRFRLLRKHLAVAGVRSASFLAASWRAFACALGAPSAWPTSPASRPTGPARISMASLPAAGLPLRQSRSQAPGRPGPARPTRLPEALR